MLHKETSKTEDIYEKPTPEQLWLKTMWFGHLNTKGNLGMQDIVYRTLFIDMNGIECYHTAFLILLFWLNI